MKYIYVKSGRSFALWAKSLRISTLQKCWAIQEKRVTEPMLGVKFMA